MRNFEDSSLWRASAFERIRNDMAASSFVNLDRPTVLPTTLLADLNRLYDDPTGVVDLLEVVALCMRHREPALLYLEHEQSIWPVTIFPGERLYHSPREISQVPIETLGRMQLVNVEPPVLRPPGHAMHERVGHVGQYHPLAPLLWAFALHGPRGDLLSEIGGTAAYRATGSPAALGLVAVGALGSAAERLRRESAALRDIAKWPGMSVERASRLLNALYLVSILIVTRAHPAARTQRWIGNGLFGLLKSRR
jgi:hypothetical protein